MRDGGAKATATSARRANPGVELFARLGIELLRIVEPARHALGIENDRRGNDRAGERPPASLVAARDRPDAALDGSALAPEGRTDVLLPERQAGDDGAAAARLMARWCAPDAQVNRRPVGM